MIKPSKMFSVFLGKSCVCPMTNVCVDRDSFDFDVNTIILGSDDNDYIFVSGFGIIKISTEE